MGVVNRFEVYLINLDPTIGSEIRKTRLCVVISPNETNQFLRTVIVAPMTTKGQHYPTRVSCTFHGKRGQLALDQIRSVDKARLVRRLGKLSATTSRDMLAVLAAMFSE